MTSRLEASLTTADTLVRAFGEFDGRWHQRTVFTDFCSAYSAALANAFLPQHSPEWQANEDRYMALVDKYGREGMERFARIGGMLVDAMEAAFNRSAYGHDDILGLVWERLDLGNDRLGQFFTPMSACTLIAQMQLADADQLLAEKPYITIGEPCVGAGRMVLAASNVLRQAGHVPARRMVAHCVDVDLLAVWMSHITLTLADVPAIIVHGNALSLQSWGTLHTFAYARGEWSHTPPRAILEAIQQATQLLAPEPEPSLTTPPEPVADQRGQLILF